MKFKEFLLELDISAEVKNLQTQLENLYKEEGLELYMYYSKNTNTIEISKIALEKQNQKKGTGSAIMKKITDFADSKNIILTLSPSTDFGGSSVSRLRSFYSKFGFIKYSGRKANSRLSAAMYRPVAEAVNNLKKEIINEFISRLFK